MKKIFILIFLLILSRVSAQDADTLSKSEENTKFDFYAMEGEYVIHYFLAINTDTLLDDISLKNGNTITSKAEIIKKNGKIIFLKQGECVDWKGNITECSEVRKKVEDAIRK